MPYFSRNLRLDGFVTRPQAFLLVGRHDTVAAGLFFATGVRVLISLGVCCVPIPDDFDSLFFYHFGIWLLRLLLLLVRLRAVGLEEANDVSLARMYVLLSTCVNVVC